ncbi:transcription factor E2FA-like [Bidens hawaiensis]|uniref:transcription factor E2FA-like n=1 Tax=Bidens hawaiensis TaxID=980011 RepID=UPI00404A2149
MPKDKPSSGGKQPVPPPRHLKLNSTKPPFAPFFDYHQFPAKADSKRIAITADQDDNIVIVRSPPVKRKFGTNVNEMAPNKLTVSGKGQWVNHQPKITKNQKSPLNHPASNSRFESSLVVITKKFSDLMKQAGDGIIDLNIAAETLNTSKRRLYDVTNVLDGIGLIEKDCKNRIRWKREDSSKPEEMTDDVAQLKAEIEELSLQENALDENIREMQDEIRNLSEDDNNQKWLYVTHDDIKNMLSGENGILIAIRAPQETALEVSLLEVVDHPQRRYRMIILNTTGPVDMYLLSEYEEEFDDMPIASRSGPNDNPEPGYNMTSERNIPQDSSGGIMNMVNDDPDYWLFSNIETPLTDMWDISLDDVDWDDFDLPSDELGLVDDDISVPNRNGQPFDAPS